MRPMRATEDYLKTIYILTRKGGTHGSDVARMLNVSRPTVSVALKNLIRDGYVWTDVNHLVFLTEEGDCIARETYTRNQFFQNFLLELGVDGETARQDACKMEHAVSPESFQAIQSAWNAGKFCVERDEAPTA